MKQKLTEEQLKQAVHYYVDGGLKKGIAVSAFLRKSYYLKTKSEFRRYPRSKSYTSTDAEIRAIKLALEDAMANNIAMENVVIHTDQRSLVFGKVKNSNSKLYALSEELKSLGVSVRYDRSIHDLNDYKSLDQVPKRELNPFLVHRLVNDNFKTMNRYQIHLLKKKKK